MTGSSDSDRLLSGTLSDDACETLITSNEVSPDQAAAYEAADRALNEAAARFPGFAGACVSQPRAGGRTWSTMVRFKSKADMDRWLASPERAADSQTCTGQRSAIRPAWSRPASAAGLR